MYGFTRMHYRDCGLEVAKSKVTDLGMSINHEEVQMIKKTYV